ncbi:MAG: monofunctional biosynthetic peptidoglycan transglycosylase [Nitrospinales bacterium]
MPRTQSKSKTRKKKISIRIPLGRIFFDLLLLFLAVTVIPVMLYGIIDPPTTPLMWIRWAEGGYQNDAPKKLASWVTLEEVSPHLIKAVIASEDQRYFRHKGFDWYAIKLAFIQNFRNDKKIGASTISMQTARNVFLWQDRTWLRKALEAYFTFLIEIFWNKKRILEVYLNVIEWGNGIYGCDLASRTYFNHSAKSTSPIESAWMAAILPNPRAWSIHNPPQGVVERQAKILDWMYQLRIPLRL